VVIAREDKLNAFNTVQWQQLRSVFDGISLNPDVRCVILYGRGRAFTAGLDITDNSLTSLLLSSDPARVAVHLRRHIDDFQDAISSIERCEKPVICVLHGISFGLALDIASAADVRYCAADVRFSVKEVDIGLAADIGSLQRMPKIVGSASWVREIALTAREFSAEEALQNGFVSKVLPTKEEAIAEAHRVAATIASKSPVAVQTTKRVLNYSRDHSVADGLAYVAEANSAAVQSTDTQAAIGAIFQKKKPTFSKL